MHFMAPKTLFVCILLTFSFSFHGISTIAVKFEVFNDAPQTPGGIKFDKEIGIPYTKELMPKVADFIWSTFQQNSPADRKPFDVVTIRIKDVNKNATAMTTGNRIEVNPAHIVNYKDVKGTFTGIMYHEGAHVFQWFGENKTPIPLIEGIADWIRIKANNTDPNFTKPGDGDSWITGYGVTARFLEYCDGLVPGFTAKLNNKMRKTYDVAYFKELSGKPVEQLWKEYKAKYAKKN